jgi:hypothetical protein
VTTPQAPAPAVCVPPAAGAGSICCGDCHAIAERLIRDLHAILAHHNLTVDIRVLSDETLADQLIHRIDRAAQAAGTVT